MWIGSRGVYPLFFITTIHHNPKYDVVLDCFLSCCKLYFTVSYTLHPLSIKTLFILYVNRCKQAFYNYKCRLETLLVLHIYYYYLCTCQPTNKGVGKAFLCKQKYLR